MNNRNYSPETLALTDILMKQCLFPSFQDDSFYSLTFFRKELHLKSFSFFDKCPIDQLNKINPPVISYDPTNALLPINGDFREHWYSFSISLTFIMSVLKSFVYGHSRDAKISEPLCLWAF